MAEVFAFIPLSARPSWGSRRSGASKEKQTTKSGHGTAGRVGRNLEPGTMNREELHALALVCIPPDRAASRRVRLQDP